MTVRSKMVLQIVGQRVRIIPQLENQVRECCYAEVTECSLHSLQVSDHGVPEAARAPQRAITHP